MTRVEEHLKSIYKRIARSELTTPPNLWKPIGHVLKDVDFKYKLLCDAHVMILDHKQMVIIIRDVFKVKHQLHVSQHWYYFDLEGASMYEIDENRVGIAAYASTYDAIDSEESWLMVVNWRSGDVIGKFEKFYAYLTYDLVWTCTGSTLHLYDLTDNFHKIHSTPFESHSIFAMSILPKGDSVIFVCSDGDNVFVIDVLQNTVRTIASPNVDSIWYHSIIDHRTILMAYKTLMFVVDVESGEILHSENEHCYELVSLGGGYTAMKSSPTYDVYDRDMNIVKQVTGESMQCDLNKEYVSWAEHNQIVIFCKNVSLKLVESFYDVEITFAEVRPNKKRKL
jgi:WD40 repeat protein